MKLLSKEERQRVEQAVERAEQETAGELAVVMTPRSDDYGLNRGIVAVVLSTVGLYEVGYLLPQLPRELLWSAVIPLWWALYALVGWGPVLRLIVRRDQRQHKVEERARAAFIECGVTETRDRSGVLLFLSEAEHQVVILADKGINERVQAEEWNDDVRTIVEGIVAGQAAQGLEKAIARIGSILAEAFPPRADDENELTNQVQEV